jgi:hypothetical protein
MGAQFLSLFWYEQWYTNDVSPNLSREQKLMVARRISELSLKEPIYMSGLQYPKSKFPELESFSHTSEFSGLQLYATLTEIMRELGAPVLSASQVATGGRKWRQKSE